MNAHLISDLHLSATTPHLTAILVHFLRTRARELPALFLLGDIFEVWIGDDERDELSDTVANELLALVNTGVKAYFMHGNRDFLLGESYAQRAGITLLPDPYVVNLGDSETLLTHGDRYCTRDVAYQQFRQQSRNPAWQAQILAQPLQQRRALAQHIRQESMLSQQTKLLAGEPLADVVDAEVIDDLIQYGVKRVIHGHTHQPREHLLQLPDGSQAERIVLADWRSEGEALEVQSEGSLVRHTLA